MRTTLTIENLARLTKHYQDTEYDRDAFISSYIDQQSSLVSSANAGRPHHREVAGASQRPDVRLETTAHDADGRKEEGRLSDVPLQTGSGRKRKRIIDGLRLRDGSSPRAQPSKTPRASASRRSPYATNLHNPTENKPIPIDVVSSRTEEPCPKKKRHSTITETEHERPIATKPFPAVSLAFARRDQERARSVDEEQDVVGNGRATRARTTSQKRRKPSESSGGGGKPISPQRGKSDESHRLRASNARSKFISQTERLTVSGELLKRVGLFNKGARSAKLSKPRTTRNLYVFDEHRFLEDPESPESSHVKTTTFAHNATANSTSQRPRSEDPPPTPESVKASPTRRASPVASRERSPDSVVHMGDVLLKDRKVAYLDGNEAGKELQKVFTRMARKKEKDKGGGKQQHEISKYFARQADKSLGREKNADQTESEDNKENREQHEPPRKNDCGVKPEISQSGTSTKVGEAKKLPLKPKNTGDASGRRTDKSTDVSMEATLPKQRSKSADAVRAPQISKLNRIGNSAGAKSTTLECGRMDKPTKSILKVKAQSAPGAKGANIDLETERDMADSKENSFWASEYHENFDANVNIGAQKNPIATEEDELMLELSRTDALLREVTEATMERLHAGTNSVVNEYRLGNSAVGALDNNCDFTAANPNSSFPQIQGIGGAMALGHDNPDVDMSGKHYAIDVAGPFQGDQYCPQQTITTSWTDNYHAPQQQDQADVAFLREPNLQEEFSYRLPNPFSDTLLHPAAIIPEETPLAELMGLNRVHDDVQRTLDQLPWKQSGGRSATGGSSGASSARRRWVGSSDNVRVGGVGEMPFSMPRRL
ncbi:hypothetical protein HDU93_008641 [Gonapodya sp. JEL0774]|nr:hypothetical protein HDU93_008641 [Gonapodya sp. JEL0774]